MPETHEDKRLYKVVLNQEEQYSIWPVERENPNGWNDGGRQGTKAECLAYIREVWTDIRPKSLRTWMAEQAQLPAAKMHESDSGEPEVRSLVERLAEREHAIEFRSRIGNSPAVLKTRIESGFVQLNFAETQGGTELSIRLDPNESDWSGVDFTKGSGSLLIVGSLTLDGTPVRCTATLDCATLKGTGRLQPRA